MLIEKLNQYKIQVELKQKEEELAKQQEHLRISNDQIQQLKQELSNKHETEKSQLSLNKIIRIFNQKYISDKDWGEVIILFRSIYPEVFSEPEQKNIKLSANDIRVIILQKLGYTNQGMSEILNISIEGVKKAKQRLNKKLHN